jgi:hypothetical protein
MEEGSSCPAACASTFAAGTPGTEHDFDRTVILGGWGAESPEQHRFASGRGGSAA